MAEAHVMPAAGATADDTSREPWPSPARAWYAVAIFGLTVFTLFGHTFMVALILEPLKHDLKLSDVQVSLVFGTAAPFVLAFASLLISPLADLYSRRFIIGAGLIILGTCNFGSAVVGTVSGLLLLRLIGGFGGAGNGPATFSLLADTFPPAKLPKAMATMNIGFMFAIGLTYLVGGYLIRALSTPEYTLPVLGTLRAWQVVFLVMATPDLLLGLLVWLTVLEPKRRGRAMTGGAARASLGATLASVVRDYKPVVEYLWANRKAFGPMYIGLFINCVALVGNSTWMAPFYQRTFGWGPGDFGVYQGWLLLVLAPAGLLFGGWLAERLAKRGVADANQRVVVWASLAHIPFAVSFALVPNPWVALVLASLNTCVIGIGTGPQNAAFQAIVPNDMRAKITATFLFMFTIGGALGPLFVSSITTYVFGDPDELRYSLALTHGLLGPAAVIVFWTGLRAYGEAFTRARAFQG
ncbi:MAG TPA: MFS transporter [Steroidobacteraceae bacterium]|nr:MFS transporter [Steroidobacteraceae bacterium]